MVLSLDFLQQVDVKISKKYSKIAKIEEEKIHIFWAKWWISMKFLGKLSLMIILKATKNQTASSV